MDQKFESRKFHIRSNIDKIEQLLNRYFEAGQNFQDTQTSIEPPQVSSVTIKANRNKRKGVPAALIRKIEDLSGSSLGGHVLELPEETIQLASAPAVTLFEGYTKFINEALAAEKIFAKDTQKEEISSPHAHFIFFTELCLRLGARIVSQLAVTGNITLEFVDIMRGFVSNTVSSNLLDKRKGQEASKFQLKMHAEMGSWIQCFQQLNESITLINSEKIAIRNTMQFLFARKRQITIQLIAFLSTLVNVKELNLKDFTPRYLKNTLEKCKLAYQQKYTSPKHRSLNESDRKNIIIRSLDNAIETKLKKNKTITLHTVLNKITNHDKPFNKETIKKKITGLLDIMTHTENLIKIVSDISMLIDFSGWIPIMTGILNLHELANEITSYAEQTEKALHVNEDQMQMFSELMKLALIHGGSTNYSSLGKSAKKIATSLDRLHNPELLRQLIDYIMPHVRSLVVMQRTIQRNIINEQKFLNLGIQLNLENHANSLSENSHQSQLTPTASPPKDSDSRKEKNKRNNKGKSVAHALVKHAAIWSKPSPSPKKTTPSTPNDIEINTISVDKNKLEDLAKKIADVRSSLEEIEKKMKRNEKTQPEKLALIQQETS